MYDARQTRQLPCTIHNQTSGPHATSDSATHHVAYSDSWRGRDGCDLPPHAPSHTHAAALRAHSLSIHATHRETTQEAQRTTLLSYDIHDLGFSCVFGQPYTSHVLFRTHTAPLPGDTLIKSSWFENRETWHASPSIETEIEVEVVPSARGEGTPSTHSHCE